MFTIACHLTTKISPRLTSISITVLIHLKDLPLKITCVMSAAFGRNHTLATPQVNAVGRFSRFLWAYRLSVSSCW